MARARTSRATSASPGNSGPPPRSHDPPRNHGPRRPRDAGGQFRREHPGRLVVDREHGRYAQRTHSESAPPPTARTLLPKILRGVSTLAALTLSTAALADTLYVDANLATGSNDGSSWSNAYQSADGLQVALAASTAGDAIFVAQGTYTPTSTGQRFATFILKSGVEVYGSFAGTEATPAERPPFGTAPSILSGDLAGDDASGLFSENSFHVLNGGGTDATAVLDGFTVTGGNSNGNTTNFNRGGGIICVSVASPTLRNCRFVANRATFGGGAAYVNGTAPSFTDCAFEDNIGGGFGGAVDVAAGGAVSFERCSFSRNNAARAGALEIFATNGAVVANCVFEGNVATGPSGGGAIWVGGGGSCALRNLTVVANTAAVSD